MQKNKFYYQNDLGTNPGFCNPTQKDFLQWMQQVPVLGHSCICVQIHISFKIKSRKKNNSYNI